MIVSGLLYAYVLHYEPQTQCKAQYICIGKLTWKGELGQGKQTHVLNCAMENFQVGFTK